MMTEREPGTEQAKRITEPSAGEIADLQALLKSAHTAYRRIGYLTLLGVVIFISGLLYYGRLDYYPLERGDRWVDFSAEYLPTLVENDRAMLEDTFVFSPGVSKLERPQRWPEIMYCKLRFDIYFFGVMVFLLCLVCLKIASARSKKNDLLVFRTMAREIERLRTRVQSLESGDGGKAADGGEDNTGADKV